MGLSTAYQLARRSNLKVLVLEQGAGLGEGSTGASSAVCRHRYSIDAMVELARDGINAYRHWQEFTGIDQPVAKFHPDGVLWLQADGKAWADKECDRMQRLAIKAEVLDEHEVHNRFPSLSTCLTSPDLITGTAHDCNQSGHFLFETDGGYFDPVDALTDLREALSKKNVQVRCNTKVRAITTASGRATGVELETGQRLSSGMVINTTGPWCNDLLEPLGLAGQWPLKPTRIQIIHIDKPAAIAGKIPVCCDLVGGIYFREQNRGQQIVMGSTLEEDEHEVVDPSNYNNWVDDEFKIPKLHALKHRIPDLPRNLTVAGYTGLYTVNQTDVHPVVGVTEIDGLFVCNGFSGHGFKIGPAIGSLLAQQITGDILDFDTQVSPDFLAFNRTPLSVDSLNVMA